MKTAIFISIFITWKLCKGFNRITAALKERKKILPQNFNYFIYKNV